MQKQQQDSFKCINMVGHEYLGDNSYTKYSKKKSVTYIQKENRRENNGRQSVNR